MVQPETDRQQVEQRLEEPDTRNIHPRRLCDDIALDQQARPAATHFDRAGDPQRQRECRYAGGAHERRLIAPASGDRRPLAASTAAGNITRRYTAWPKASSPRDARARDSTKTHATDKAPCNGR